MKILNEGGYNIWYPSNFIKKKYNKQIYKINDKIYGFEDWSENF
jgi:hypothetical protein